MDMTSNNGIIGSVPPAEKGWAPRRKPREIAGEEDLQLKTKEGPYDLDLKLGDRSVLIRREAEFVEDPKTGDMVIRVYDSKTREILFEFPPERLQEFRKLFKESLGNLLDETV